MSRKLVVAIAGATGVVGQEMMTILVERKFPLQSLKLLASENSVGELYEAAGESYEVELLTEDSFKGVDVALFATSAELSAKFVPAAVKAGAVVIDNSSHFRMHPEIPLVVPEVNGHLINSDQKIYANPNCSTIQLVPVLNVINQAAILKRVVVSTYQSVSGAGKGGLDELWAQSLAIFSQKELPQEVFPRQIAFNCIPHIDVFLESGYTKEEMKIVNESRKILGLPDLRITATAVRVPVFHSHAESVNVETERELRPAELIELLEKAEGISVTSHMEDYTVQLDAAGGDPIFVSRIRQDSSVPHGLDMWVVADNVRKGAALNAVQIAEKLL